MNVQMKRKMWFEMVGPVVVRIVVFYETVDEMVGGDLTQQRSNETYIKERRVVEDLRRQQQNWYGDDEMDERKESAAVRQDKEEGNENGTSEQNVQKDWNGRKENGNGEKDGREDGEVNAEEDFERVCK